MLIVGFTGNCGPEDVARSRESEQDLFWNTPAPPNEAALIALENAREERQRKWKKEEKEKDEEEKGTKGGGEGEGRGDDED